MNNSYVNKKSLLAGLFLVLAANASVAYGATEEKTAKKDVKKVVKAQEEEIIKNLAPNNKDIAIGKGASIKNTENKKPSGIFDKDKLFPNTKDGFAEGSIALGLNAKVVNYYGGQEKGISFGDKPTSSIAIGSNAVARTGSTIIGAHDYTGKFGSYEKVNSGEFNNSFVTTIGGNSYTWGALGTVTGAYSMVTGKAKDNLDKGRGFGSVINGSLNLIETRNGDGLDGGGNALIGLANKTDQSNGGVIIGAGNEITNSYGNMGGMPGILEGMSIKDPDKFRDFLRGKISGGATGGASLAIGGGNTIDNAIKTQVIGMRNTVNGGSENVLLDGLENKASKAKNTYVIGLNNELENVNNTIILGDNHKIKENDGNIIIGFNTEKEIKDSIIVLGNNASATGENAVAIGTGSVATANTVSVGAENNYRKITNVADGTEEHDAVNFGQLNKKLDTETAEDTYATKTSLDSYAKVDVVTKNTDSISGINTILKGEDGKSGLVATVDTNTKNIGAIQNAIAQGDDIINNEKTGILAVNEAQTKDIQENKDAIAKNTEAINGKLDGIFSVNDEQVAWNKNQEETNKKFENSIAKNTTDIATNATTISQHTKALVKKIEQKDIEDFLKNTAKNKDAVALGHNNQATKIGSVAFGVKNSSEAAYSSAIGYGNHINPSADKSNAFGVNNFVEGEKNTVLGINGKVNAKESGYIGIMNKENANPFNEKTLEGNNSYAIGNYNSIKRGSDNNFILGNNVAIKSNISNSVVLGDSSTVTESNVVSVGAKGNERKIVNVANGINTTDAVNFGQLRAIETGLGEKITENTNTINGKLDGINLINDKQAAWNKIQEKTNKALGDNIAKNTENIKANTEAINGKIDGIFNASTDNINVSAWQNALGMTVKLRGNYISSENTVAANLGALDTQVKKNAIAISGVDNKTFTEDEIKNIIDEKLSAGVESGNGSVVIGATGDKESSIYGDDAVVIGSGNTIGKEGQDASQSTAVGNQNKVTGVNSIAVGSENTVTGNNSGVFGDPSVVNGDGSYSIGNDNTIVGDDNFILGNNVTIDKDVNGNEIKGSVALGQGSSVKESNVVSVGAKGNERKIVNVADGVNDTDAVNVRQLNATTDGVVNNARNIEKLDGRVKHVGALSAALAGLHPMQYDPYNPNQLMAAVGSYRDKQAVAVGATHYFNENLMLSAGLSIGTENRDPEVMGNVGVTWKIGKGGETQNYDVPANYNQKEMAAMYAMQTEMDKAAMKNAKLENEVEKQRAELEEMKKLVKQLMQSRR